MATKRRFSKQRECILEALKNTKSHPSANSIYEMVRQQIPNISLGTVYRNLSELNADGAVLKIDAGDGVEHYDGCNTPHYHLFCKKCNSVSDIELDYNTPLDTAARNASGAEIEYHSVIFAGTCRECKNSEK